VNLLEVDNSQPGTFAERAQAQKKQLWQDLEHRYLAAARDERAECIGEKWGRKPSCRVVFTSLLNLDETDEETNGSNRFGEPLAGITQHAAVYLDLQWWSRIKGADRQLGRRRRAFP